MVDQLPDAVVVLDTLNRIVDLNPSALKLLGLDSKALGALALETFPQNLVAFVASISSRASAEVRLGAPDAERTYDAKLLPLRGDGGLAAGRLLVVQDVTERTREAEKLRELEMELRRANASLEQRANVDPLTGLPRRENFLERLDEEFARSRRYELELSLLVLDVDRFKAVNDGHGHRVGDQVLAAIAQVMASQKRQTDFVGRLGGDEFGMLLTGTGLVGARDVADRLGSRTSDLRLPVSAGKELLVTLSIGVVTLEPPCKTSQDLLDRADAALYRAKNQGRNRIAAAESRD